MRSSERGSATVSIAGASIAVVIVAGISLSLGFAVISQRHLSGAVDLAALAAADVSVGVRPGQPCGIARALLVRANVLMLSCEVWEDSFVVVGEKQRGAFTLRATARAGVVDGGEK